MKNIPIFALEGAAFAGKTTVLNYLKTKYTDKVTTIPEASEYVGGDKNFPNAPFKTLNEAKASTYFFIELEKRRCRDAITSYIKTGLPVVMDRTTPVSSLFFYSLLAYDHPIDSTFINSYYRHALDAFQAQVDAGNIFIPDGLIYLRPIDRTTFENRLVRGTKNTVFSKWENYKFLDNKYQSLIRFHYKNNHVLILDSQNTPKNLEQSAKNIIDFIGLVRPPFISDIFNTFLNKSKKSKLNILSREEREFSKIMNYSRALMDKTNLKI
jgi:thymidylate kinase